MQSSEPLANISSDELKDSGKPLSRTTISKQSQWNLYIAALFVSDMLMMALAYRVGYWIRFELHIPVFVTGVVPSIRNYQLITLVTAFIWLAIFIIIGLYNKDHLLGGPEEYGMVFRASIFAILVMIVAVFLYDQILVSRGWLIASWFLAFLFISFGRFILRRVIYRTRKLGWFVNRAIIVGANNEGILLANQLSNPLYSGLEIIGFVDKKFLPDTVPARGLRVLGNMDHLEALVKEQNVEEIILASSSITSRDKLLEIFQEYGVSDDVHVRMSSGLYEIITTGLSVREYAYVPLVCVNKVRLTGVDNAVKTVLDYFVVVPSMLFILPLFLVIGIAIKLDSPGRVFYRRRVMGQNNRQFDAFKFRTMHVNGDEILAKNKDLLRELEEKRKLKDDPRVTRVGRFLRKFSLDELPQLFNVLLGDMSLVGPRMIHPDEMVEYNTWGMNLLTVKPGLTGLWQVSGRSDLSYADRVRLDMHYIRNWSIWLDLQLLMQTLPAVLRSRGAY